MRSFLDSFHKSCHNSNACAFIMYMEGERYIYVISQINKNDYNCIDFVIAIKFGRFTCG